LKKSTSWHYKGSIIEKKRYKELDFIKFKHDFKKVDDDKDNDKRELFILYLFQSHRSRLATKIRKIFLIGITAFSSSVFQIILYIFITDLFCETKILFLIIVLFIISIVYFAFLKERIKNENKDNS